MRAMSFAYKEGVPDTADYVFDMRFLRNPHWSRTLRDKTGLTDEVDTYVRADQNFETFFSHLTQMSRPILEQALRDGRPQITFAFGCTGGKHRSVVTAAAYDKWASGEGHKVTSFHRELQNKETQS